MLNVENWSNALKSKLELSQQKCNDQREAEEVLRQSNERNRIIIEGIEEAALKGGGYLLWAGCAAGVTGGAMVLKVG